MRFETTPQFDRDWKRLKPEHQRTFRTALHEFIPACDAYAQAGGGYTWPQTLRVKPMKSAPGIWEMTWSFASPDGRATFEWITDEHGLKVRWRRIGDHAIYRTP